MKAPNHIILDDAPASAEYLVERLDEQAHRVLKQQNPTHRQVVQITIPISAALEPLCWLRAQPASAKVYWRGRSYETTIAAAGTADTIRGDELQSPSDLEKAFPLLSDDHPAARYYGGLRFDYRRAPEAEWGPFGAYWFMLPRFELHHSAAQTSLTCNIVLPDDGQHPQAITDEIAALTFPTSMRGAAQPPVDRTDAPERKQWIDNVQTTLSTLHRTTLEKVVLARRSDFGWSEPLDPFFLLSRLQADTPGCFHFLFQPSNEAAFIGASPERLFHRENEHLQTEALAGTRPRGHSTSADEKLRDELLHSEKDRREHEYVRQTLVSALAPLSRSLEVDTDVSEMKLSRGRHLYSRVEAVLHGNTSTFDLLSALHPTPAVGGLPRGEALELIQRMEPFDRGWYAGPVGWIGADAAEFAVGIRSGLVYPHRLSLFSGAGIVEGSDPASEWAEIEQKIDNFVQVLDLDVQSVLR